MGREKALVANFLLVTCMVIATGRLVAQQGDRIPPFAMTLADGRYFTAAQLPKGRPLVLIYFAPDCDHCHTLMNAFFQKADRFRNAEVVLVTYKPIGEVAAFVRAFEATKYGNIKVGTEGNTNYLRLFYKLQQTPFTAVYDKNGKLVKTYRKNTSVEDLVMQVTKL